MCAVPDLVAEQFPRAAAAMNLLMDMEQQLLFDIGPELEELSFSRISLFLRCPLEYRWRFIDGLSQAGQLRGEEAQLGRILHTVASRFLSAAEDTRTEQHATRLLETTWKKASWAFPQESGAWYSKARDAVARLAASELLQIKNAQVEVRFNRQRVNDLLLTGRADVVGSLRDQLAIVELKSELFEIEIGTGPIDRLLQLIFYYHGLRGALPSDPSRLMYYFFLSGEIEEIQTTRELMYRGLERIKQLGQEMKLAKRFVARPSRYCWTCRFSPRCAFAMPRETMA